ncbi:MAG: hypothetical protein MHM6MM_000620 [Cercozoa sp. M6MM]
MPEFQPPAVPIRTRNRAPQVQSHEELQRNESTHSKRTHIQERARATGVNSKTRRGTSYPQRRATMLGTAHWTERTIEGLVNRTVQRLLDSCAHQLERRFLVKRDAMQGQIEEHFLDAIGRVKDEFEERMDVARDEVAEVATAVEANCLDLTESLKEETRAVLQNLSDNQKRLISRVDELFDRVALLSTSLQSIATTLNKVQVIDGERDPDRADLSTIFGIESVNRRELKAEPAARRIESSDESDEIILENV